MTDLKKIFHSFGIDQLLNASTSGLLLFEKVPAGKSKQREEYVCSVDNAAARTLTGHQRHNGLSWGEAFGRESTGQVPSLDTEVCFPKTDRWCRVSNTPIDSAHFLCTLTDITAFKEVSQRETILTGILRDAEKTMQFGTWIWYHTQGVVEWSEGMYVMLGYGPEEAHENPADTGLFMSHVHPDDAERLRKNLPRLSKGPDPVECEFRIVTLSGEERSVLSRSIHHEEGNGQPSKITGCLMDITSMKQIRNQLVKNVDELNRSNTDLEQFAYVASHDLQEPLRKIVSFGERLEKRSEGALDEETGMYLDRILNATRRMQDMIVNLLEFSRLTRSKQGFEQTDLNAIAKGVLGDLEIAIRQKDAAIHFGEMPTIEAIPSQMSQLFLNLLSNSLKFTRDEVDPVIKVTSEVLSQTEQVNYGMPPSRTYVRITVTDNGIGFENNDSSRIFTLFQRLRGRSEFEGAGIGLSVCKKVVENHSGIILASGWPGEGATFTIILPLKQS